MQTIYWSNNETFDYTLAPGADGVYEATEKANPTTEEWDKVKTSVTVYDNNGNEIAANGLGNYINNDGTLKANSGLYINGNVATQDDVDMMVDSSKAFDTGTLILKLHVGADATDNNQISVKIDAMSADGLGAVQNRLEHTISNLDNVVENTTSAESQIRDTDMATEMVKYSNNILAQTNQSNQGVLSLLQ